MIHCMGSFHIVSYDHHCSLLIQLFSWSQNDSHTEDLVYLPLLRLGHCLLGLVWSQLQSSGLPDSSSLFLEEKPYKAMPQQGTRFSAARQKPFLALVSEFFWSRAPLCQWLRDGGFLVSPDNVAVILAAESLWRSGWQEPPLSIHDNLPPIGGFPLFLTFEKLCALLSSRALKWHKPGVSSFFN